MLDHIIQNRLLSLCENHQNPKNLPSVFISVFHPAIYKIHVAKPLRFVHVVPNGFRKKRNRLLIPLSCAAWNAC